jgi:hypothetical protein
MFKWYQNAAICYAYLSDVNIDEKNRASPYPPDFPGSRWFTRGWTLQELLAPLALVFYSADWSRIGNRTDLVGVITAATGIHTPFFEHRDLTRFSIAQRMSWASKRQTTRIEDGAYCLLGLFGVNMPLLYGEGEIAFKRLQLEIMKESDDHTLFAWRITQPLLPWMRSTKREDASFNEADSPVHGILAPSLTSFAGAGHIIQSRIDRAYGSYTTTNSGLQISLPLFSAGTAAVISRTVEKYRSIIPVHHVAILNCEPSNDSKMRVGLCLFENRASGRHYRLTDIVLIPHIEVKSGARHTAVLIHLQEKQQSNSLTYPPYRRVVIHPLDTLTSEFWLNKFVGEIPWIQEPTSTST